LDVHRLARGPGCVTRALAITRAHNGVDLTIGRVRVETDRDLEGMPIGRSPRIGVSVAAERPWRFFLVGHPCVSGPARFNRVGAARARAGASAR
jgi:DNA-3-methyladenine glycosylase